MSNHMVEYSNWASKVGEEDAELWHCTTQSRRRQLMKNNPGCGPLIIFEPKDLPPEPFGIRLEKDHLGKTHFLNQKETEFPDRSALKSQLFAMDEVFETKNGLDEYNALLERVGDRVDALGDRVDETSQAGDGLKKEQALKLMKKKKELLELLEFDVQVEKMDDAGTLTKQNHMLSRLDAKLKKAANEYQWYGVLQGRMEKALAEKNSELFELEKKLKLANKKPGLFSRLFYKNTKKIFDGKHGHLSAQKGDKVKDVMVDVDDVDEADHPELNTEVWGLVDKIYAINGGEETSTMIEEGIDRSVAKDFKKVSRAQDLQSSYVDFSQRSIPKIEAGIKKIGTKMTPLKQKVEAGVKLQDMIKWGEKHSGWTKELGGSNVVAVEVEDDFVDVDIELAMVHEFKDLANKLQINVEGYGGKAIKDGIYGLGKRTSEMREKLPEIVKEAKAALKEIDSK